MKLKPRDAPTYQQNTAIGFVGNSITVTAMKTLKWFSYFSWNFFVSLTWEKYEDKQNRKTTSENSGTSISYIFPVNI